MTARTALAALLLLAGASARAGDTAAARSAVFADSVTVAATPEETYDAVTGDISPWWDHSMSGSPLRLYLEPRPGGGFYEIFNERGDGALHATVILADRPRRLRFDGPLGLSGMAVTMVTTYDLRPAGPDSTVLVYSVRMSGDFPDTLPAVVRSTWHHFMVERLKPHIDSGRHREPRR